MNENASFLSERLRVEGVKTITFFAALSPEQWEYPIYTEGEMWTIRNVLAHFVTAEKGFVRIFGEMLNGGQGVAEDFDIDRYNTSQQRKTKDLTPDELLDQFREIRSHMIAFVEGLSDEDLTSEGRHPYLGQTTLSEMIKMVYRHNLIHYRDLRKSLG